MTKKVKLLRLKSKLISMAEQVVPKVRNYNFIGIDFTEDQIIVIFRKFNGNDIPIVFDYDE